MSGLSPTWAALKAVTDDLMVMRGQLAEVQMAEHEGRVTAYLGSEGTSVSAKERDADVHVMRLATDVIELRAQIRAKEDLRDLLQLAVAHGVEVV
jgi:hypothetical protein